ncbi:hypothetical protein [Radiobacillus sp. PE A8.2]|uniref:hypothetical protein n=1 Tax=Radiobacillus sp. PE A8.2 TaxID=3380349 RepID=UPI00388E5E7D
MNALIYGIHPNTNTYIDALKQLGDVMEIFLVTDNKDEQVELEGIHYISSLPEQKVIDSLDLVIVSDQIASARDEVSSLALQGIPVIIDNHIVNQLGSYLELIDRNTPILIANSTLFDPQVLDVHRNIEKGMIGELAVANIKRYTLSEYDHHAALHAELIALYPYSSKVKKVFAMERKIEDQRYSTITLRLDTGAIINIEIFTGATAFMRNGEYAGPKGIVSYSSESQMLNLKTTGSNSNFTTTKLSAKKQMIQHFINNRSNREDLANYNQIHLASLQIIEAVKRSVETASPVYLGGDHHE